MVQGLLKSACQFGFLKEWSLTIPKQLAAQYLINSIYLTNISMNKQMIELPCKVLHPLVTLVFEALWVSCFLLEIHINFQGNTNKLILLLTGW